MLKRVGRPRVRRDGDQDDPLAKYDVRLTYKQARIARRLGGNNLSEGVRAALEHAMLDDVFMSRTGKPDK